MKAPDTNKIISFAYLAALLVVLFVVYKILSGVGLIKTKKKKVEEAETQAAVNMMRTDDYWDVNYFKNKKYKSLASSTVNLYTQQLRKALRGIGTNEEAVYAVFGKLFNKCNISELSAWYYIQYGSSLQADILDDFGKKEITTLMNIINELPEN